MGKPTGFIEWQRTVARRRGVEQRLGDHRELEHEQTPEQARQQAGRCMDCGVPFCHQGCPLGNPIGDFNDEIYRNRFRNAYLQLSSTNNFPEFTGRLCPAPCEAACTLSINRQAVTIELIEKLIIERAFVEGWVQARPPTRRSGKRVAVVGSGPAGMAAAAQLNQAGHNVTIFERDDRPGGLLRYGIPDFKLEKSVLDRRLELLEAEGIKLRCSVDVGTTLSWQQLRDEHDAVLIAVGARVPRELDVPGRELTGVVQAMTYLEQQNRLVAGMAVEGRIDAAGARVMILGGGDTGSDCLGTALRQGAAQVTQVELFPAPPDGRASDNPWPQWPMIFRSSPSHEEGGQREYGLKTQRLEGNDGKLTRLHAVRVELRDGKLCELPDSELSLDVDLLILAMGFVGPDAQPIAAKLGVRLDGRGNIATTDDYACNVSGVFAAGDARRGQSLVVWAIAEGREAAGAIDTFLRGRLSVLPSRGVDCHFGGR